MLLILCCSCAFSHCFILLNVFELFLKSFFIVLHVSYMSLFSICFLICMFLFNKMFENPRVHENLPNEISHIELIVQARRPYSVNHQGHSVREP